MNSSMKNATSFSRFQTWLNTSPQLKRFTLQDSTKFNESAEKKRERQNLNASWSKRTGLSTNGEYPVQRFVGRFGTKEMEPAMQDALMKFDPATGEERPYPSHATQWRNWHGIAAWLFDPWTGRRRNAYDVGSDVHGLLIAPAGTLGMDMGGGCSTTTEGVMKRQLEESK